MKKILILLFISTTYVLNGQIGFNSLSSSPTAAGLAKFAQTPVDLSTGVPNISVPLVELQGLTLSLPITLNYHSQGLRVTERASWVGLGWNLNAGGVITRNVNGLHDECISTHYWHDTEDHFIDELQHPNVGGYLANNELIEEGMNNNVLARATRLGILDLQPDEFFFNFMGHVGSFMFNKEDNPVLFPYGTETINWDYSVTGEFTITDVLGYTYNFKEFEYTGFDRSEECSEEQTIYPFANNGFTTSWYLTEIINLNGQTEFLFEYEENSEPSTITTTTQAITFSNSGTMVESSNWSTCNYNQSDIKSCTTSAIYNIVHPKKISFIGGYVLFIQDVNDRVDLPNDFALKQIKLFNADDLLLKSFELEYTYNSENADNSRLFLSRLLDTFSEDAIELEKFEYYPGNLPSYNSYAQDHWGFYNGMESNTSLLPTYNDGQSQFEGAYRTANLGYSKFGVLSKITHIGGSTTNYNYGLNTFNHLPQNSAQIGNYISQPQDRKYSICNFGGYGFCGDPYFDPITEESNAESQLNYRLAFANGANCMDVLNDETFVSGNPDMDEILSNNYELGVFEPIAEEIHSVEFTVDHATDFTVNCMMMSPDEKSSNGQSYAHSGYLGFRIRIYPVGSVANETAIIDFSSAAIAKNPNSSNFENSPYAINQNSFTGCLSEGTYKLCFDYFFPEHSNSGNWQYGVGPNGFYVFPTGQPLAGYNEDEFTLNMVTDAYYITNNPTYNGILPGTDLNSDSNLSPLEVALALNSARATVTLHDYALAPIDFAEQSGGGLRIVLINSDNQTEIDSETSTEFVQYDYGNHGYLLSIPRYGVNTRAGLTRNNFDCNGNDSHTKAISTSLTSQSMISLLRSQGGYVIYDQVKTTTSNGGGYTISEFSNPTITEITGVPYVPNSYEGWKAGRLKKISTYAEDTSKLTETEFIYEEDLSKSDHVRGYTSFLSAINVTETYGLNGQIDWSNIPIHLIHWPLHIFHPSQWQFDGLPQQSCVVTEVLTDHYYDHRTYVLTTGNYRVEQKIDKSFVEGGDEYLTTETNYFYDNPLLTQPTRTQIIHHQLPPTSPRRELWTRTKFSSEYTELGLPTDGMATSIMALLHRNALGVAIEQFQYFGSDEDNLYVQSAELSELAYDPNSDFILPKSKYQWLPESPIPLESSLDHDNESKLVANGNTVHFEMNSGYSRISTMDAYDAHGRLLQNHDEYDIAHSVLHDYADGRVVAEIVNAEVDECAYTSFETNNHNGFDIHDCVIVTGATTQIENGISLITSKTGLNALHLPFVSSSSAENLVSIYFPAGDSYLSFWSHGVISIDFSDNIVQIADGPTTAGNWSFNMYLLSNNTMVPSLLKIKNELSTQQEISDCLIDELRLYPADAIMSTVSFNANSSIHNVCDVNNVCEYYAYDQNQRLQWVLDENINLLQHTKYHIKGIQDFAGISNVVTHVANIAGLSAYQMTNPPPSSNNVLQNKIFSDGFGRPIQEIGVHQSPLCRDLVQFHEYNSENGKESDVYAPFSIFGTTGDYIENVSDEQSAFYLNADHVAHTTAPVAEAEYEHSPLLRQLSQGYFGEEWQLVTGHPSRSNYYFNQENEVRMWQYDANSLLCVEEIVVHYWSAFSLIKSEAQDENGKLSWTFTNQQGQVILTRTLATVGIENGIAYTSDNTDEQNEIIAALPGESDVFVDTYYLYDDLGRLKYELPPALIQLGVLEIQVNPSVANYSYFDNYIYAYEYDEKGRVIGKKIPNSDWSFFVYNNLNQIVMSQDAEQRLSNKWSWIKYDALGRSIMTGITTNTNSRVQLQAVVDSQTTNLWESRSEEVNSVNGYTNNAIPTSNDLILTITYFDDYNFDRTGLECSTIEPSSRTLGLVTGMKVLVLESSPPHYLTSVTYYNQDNLVAQEWSENLLGGVVKTDCEYDFAGRITKSTSISIFNPDDDHRITTINRFEYDKTGRLLRTYQQMGRANPDEPYPTVDPEVLLSRIHYNELGQVIKKEIHIPESSDAGMQTIDYRYNERGWLTKINNSELVDDGDNEEDYDVFGEELFYTGNEVIDDGVDELDATGLALQPLFNGNIAMTQWKVKDEDAPPNQQGHHAYIYRYDDLYRLTNARYAQYSPTLFNLSIQNGAWDEKIDYDLAGNILHLNRNRINPSMLIDPMDDLSYIYQGYQLMSVSDGASTISSNDFKQFTGTHLGQDFTYDVLGRMSHDYVKNLEYHYNLIGQTSEVQYGQNPDHCIFTFDALGNKLKKQVGSVITYYLNGGEYNASGKLIQQPTSEGCVRLNVGSSSNTTSFLYDYYLTDHLGNIRVVITEENATVQVDQATIEPLVLPAELVVFDNIPGTEKPTPSEWPTSAFAELNFAVNELSSSHKIIGPSRLLKVNIGDEISVDVESWYREEETNETGQTLLQMFGALLVNLTVQGASLNQPEFNYGAYSNSSSTPSQNIFDFLLNNVSPLTDRPQSKLVYIFMDKYLNIDPNYSGVCDVGEPDELKALTMIATHMPANGYFYTFVTNQSFVKVYFNNMTVTRKCGTIRATYDYYPYGLTWENIPDNELRNNAYQGKDFQQNEWQNAGMDLYDFHARMYDPILGRWLVPDPAEQHHNFYLAMGNNPISNTDPDGMWASDPNDYYYNSNGSFNHMTTTNLPDQFYIQGFNSNTHIGGFDSQGNFNLATSTLVYNLPSVQVAYYDMQLRRSIFSVESETSAAINLSSFDSPIQPNKPAVILKADYTSVFENTLTFARDPGEQSRSNGAINMYDGTILGTSMRAYEGNLGWGDALIVGTAMVGGVSSIGGKSLTNGGKTFAQYKASRGGTETLLKLPTSTGTQRISTEFHHAFITQRLQKTHNLPNWLVNNRINVWKLNTVQHSLIDSYRYNFLRAGFKQDIGWFGKYNWFTDFGQK